MTCVLIVYLVVVIREFRIDPPRQQSFVEAVDQGGEGVDSVAAVAVMIVVPPVLFQVSGPSRLLAAGGVDYLNDFDTPMVFVPTSIEQKQPLDRKDQA